MPSSRSDLASLPLRLMMGFGFIHHGFHNAFFSAHHAMFMWYLGEAKIPAPGITSWVISLTVFACGILIFFGAFVRIAVIPPIINVLGAYWFVHLGNGFDFMHITAVTPAEGPQFTTPGYEVPTLYLTGLVTLWLLGAGPYSIDRRRGAA